MSIFNELLPKITEISNSYAKNFNDDLKAIFECLDKFEEEYQNGRAKGRDKAQKDKTLLTTLQSINEDEDESTKTPEDKPKRPSSGKSKDTDSRSSSGSSGERRLSNKRNKNEVDGLCSPEQDKRQKRNASVKAQSIISKQVNVNLAQKMRREEPEKARGRRRKDDDKENEPDFSNVQIKEERISLPPEPMDTESLPINIEVKQEMDKDEIAMPPPAKPVPKPRKGVAKEKSNDSDKSDEDGARRSRRTTRTRKQTDTMPPPAPVAAPRATRASARRAPAAEELPPEPGARPKRTRAKKKVSETPASDTEKDTTQTQDNVTATPDKPRPKRTRRGQKAAEKEQPKPEEPKPKEISEPEPIPEPEPTPIPEPEPTSVPEPILKQERVSEPQSPILLPKLPKETKKKEIKSKIPVSDKKDATPETKNKEVHEPEAVNSMDETRVLHKMDTTVTLDMDKTVVLPNGVYNHAPVTPNNLGNMNATVVIEKFTRETIVLQKQNAIMDATVVIDKDPNAVNISEDNSILTDDNSDLHEQTPPKQIPVAQPTSAVKEKVQQFEEMASRVTRTKTRAMAKKEDSTENQTPPDKVSKIILSAETLNKMNSLIFNGKPPQISSSASKPRAAVPVPVKTVPASASKAHAISRAREEERRKSLEKEDARKKKEALLEAKREQQRRKREEKMAAAAAARSAADRERALQLEAAARERREKQATAELGKVERVREAERKKQENARKAAEIEERRRAEELKQKQKLEEEQRREAARRKQIEEAEATKKEAALMAKEIEKRQKEYLEKHKLKQKMEDRMHNTPLKLGTPGAYYPPLDPVYMADGFQYLNSDEEEEASDRPQPAWSTSKGRKPQLFIQTQLSQIHIDKLFSVRVHSPDLREIFPNIERSRLKRTSSAVWRTPPQRLPKVAE